MLLIKKNIKKPVENTRKSQYQVTTYQIADNTYLTILLVL